MLYEKIILENNINNIIKLNHYSDEGCICKNCNLKRLEIKNKLINNIDVITRIYHIETNNLNIEVHDIIDDDGKFVSIKYGIQDLPALIHNNDIIIDVKKIWKKLKNFK